MLGVGLAVGTTAGVVVLRKASDLEDACSDELCPREQQDELEQSEDLAVVATVAFIAACAGGDAAVAVAGFVWLSSEREADAGSKERVQLALSPLGAAVSAGSTTAPRARRSFAVPRGRSPGRGCRSRRSSSSPRPGR